MSSKIPASHGKGVSRRVMLKGLLASGLAVPRVAYAENSTPTVRIGNFYDLLTMESPAGERRTLFEPWVQELVSKCSRCSPQRATANETVQTFLQNFIDHSTKRFKPPPFDVFPLYAYDFLDLRSVTEIEPLLVTEWDSGPQIEYGLYVSAKSRLRSVDDLQNKTVTLEVAGRGDLARIWLDNLLVQETRNPIRDFIRARPVASPIRAILPVFFDGRTQETRVDACVVSTDGFKQVEAMNPQVSQKLRRLKLSPPMLAHVICCRKDLADEVKRDIRNVSLTMGRKSAFGRLPALRFALYKEDLIENLRKQYEEYQSRASDAEADAEATIPRDFQDARAKSATPVRPNATESAKRPPKTPGFPFRD